MKFEIDKQTISDLELFDKVKGEKSVFSFFEYTKSLGGKKRLESIYSSPLTNIESIEDRIVKIKCFRNSNFDIKIEKDNLDFIEHYLSQQNIPARISFSRSLLTALRNKIRPGNEYYIIQRGTRLLTGWLNEMYSYSAVLLNDDPDFIKDCKQKFYNKIENTSLRMVMNLKSRVRIMPHEYGKLDFCFRNLESENIRDLLDLLYEIDAYQSVALAADKHGFNFPVLTKELNYCKVQGLFHPFIENPVLNDFEFSDGKVVCFLTGPNMAGKSTFLRSISISVYLSHLGFPVPAKSMTTSVFNGLITTINLSDNLNKGYSHFYNEVLRVKYVAERINTVNNIVIVFDELFKGTNVKDAYEASLSVISAFSKFKKGLFAISTHIIEIADELNDNDAIFFKFFEANIVNETPHYDYILKDGVTNERIGMYILRKERVLETIENGINNNAADKIEIIN